jgi:hypothetical protein
MVEREEQKQTDQCRLPPHSQVVKRAQLCCTHAICPKRTKPSRQAFSWNLPSYSHSYLFQQKSTHTSQILSSLHSPTYSAWTPNCPHGQLGLYSDFTRIFFGIITSQISIPSPSKVRAQSELSPSRNARTRNLSELRPSSDQARTRKSELYLKYKNKLLMQGLNS